MTTLAPTLQAFFTDRLIRQRRVSPHTIRAYRDTIRLLVTFAAARKGTAASKLTFEDLDAKTISAFLDHLEHDRVILLIGIVKKNAIMMIDFALEAERKHGRPALEAIREACLLRFRPIMMTTMAALLGALPLAVGTGTGSELRRPLGIAIVGGSIVSQMLTLFTTPVIYLYMERLRLWGENLRRRISRKPAIRPEIVGV